VSFQGVFRVAPIGGPNQQFGTGSNGHWIGPAFRAGAHYPTFNYQIWATGLTAATTYEYEIGVIPSGYPLDQTLAVGNPVQFTTSSVGIARVGTYTGDQMSTNLTCATAKPCTGTAAVVVTAGGLSADTSGASASRGRTPTLGKAKFRIAGKHRGTITVHLTRQGAAYLRQNRNVKLQLQTRVGCETTP
jgi:hypothetical protein